MRKSRRIPWLVGALLLVSLARPASGFSILGTDAAFQLTGDLTPSEMFRWNGALPPTGGGVTTIYYRLDPTFTGAERSQIIAAFDTWNAGLAVSPNTVPGTWNWDLRSVVVHEIGHAVGLAHPGVNEEQPPNRHWDTDLDPFNPMVAPDVTNLAASANRAIATNFPGPGRSSSIMTYDVFLSAAGIGSQRFELEHDDVGGLHFTRTGRDNIDNTPDDIAYLFVLDPTNPFGVMQDVLGADGLPATADDWDESTLANMWRGGMIDVFNFNPYGQGGLADMVYDRAGRTIAFPFTIIGGDIYLAGLTAPEPGSLALIAVALLAIGVLARRPRRR